jgi:hypothetical protein
VRAERRGIGVEQGHGACLERRVDGEDQHAAIIAPGTKIPASISIARGKSTAGNLWVVADVLRGRQMRRAPSPRWGEGWGEGHERRW